MGFVRGQARPRARVASGAIDGLEHGVVREILGGLEVGVAADASDGPAVSGRAEPVGVHKDRFAILPYEIFIAVALQAVRVFDLDGRSQKGCSGQNEGEDERGSFHGVTWPATDA